MKKILSILFVGLMPIYVFGQMINSFDSEPGETYWSYESNENADLTLGYVNNSIVSDPVIEGTGAMQLEYSAHNIESWGGYTKIYHLHPDMGGVWDWSAYDSVSFSYYNSVAQSLADRVHLRLNLSDYGDVTDPSYTGLGEYYYSFHYILDNEPGWNTITLPLVRNDSWDGGGFNLTGWVGDAGNGELDRDAIAGFHLEFSIDGSGDGDHSYGTVVLDDFTLTGNENTENALLNGSFEDGMNFWSTWNVNENITISMTGENIYNSSAVFEAYDGEQALKMWGAYNGYETYTWVGQFLEVGSGGLEIGSFIMLDGMMMSHADDWIGQGANYACLALYFYDADMTTYVGGQYMALSEFVDANAPSSEWLYRDVIAQIPEGTVWVWAGVEYYQPSNDDQGSIYVDMLQTDVNVTGGSFHNFELADDWSIITSFTREEVGDVFSQTGSNGRTVIGGIDLDEDGLKEIILTDYVGHRVLVFEYLISTGNFDQVWSSPIIDNANHDSNPRTVGVGDLDSDSKGEIVFPVSAAGQEGWYIFEWDGVAGSDNYGDTYSSINSVEVDICCGGDGSSFRGDHERTTIKDIDGDGQQELVIMIRRGDTRGTLVTSVTGDIVHNAGGSGSETWASEGFVNSADYSGGSPYHSLPADLDGDGTLELVNHTWQNFNFYNIDVTGADTYVAAEPGSESSHYQASQYDNVSLFGGAAADIDNDGNDECFFPVYIVDGGEGGEGGMYLINYDENDDILQINENHVHKIMENESSMLYASIFDIDGNDTPNIFTMDYSNEKIIINNTEYSGGDITNSGSYDTQNIFLLERIESVRIYHNDGGVSFDTSRSGYPSKVQSNFNGVPLDFDSDGYKELLVSTPYMMESYTVFTMHWNGADWDTTSIEVIQNQLHPIVTLLEYGGHYFPDIIPAELSVAEAGAVHGDTILVDIIIDEVPSGLSSIDLSFAGFHGKLTMVDIIADGSSLMGSNGWAIQYNDTEDLLITAAAGAQDIDQSGKLFSLKLAVNDTVASQFVPVEIVHYLGNDNLDEYTATSGGVQVVWGPTANFISDTTTGYLPLTISFTDTSTIGTYDINQWVWDFGDDATAEGTNVQHTYYQDGNYTVALVVTDEFGLSDTLTMVDYITALHPVYPQPGFSASLTSGNYPLTVAFTDTSQAGTYAITNWIWDFGNDSTGTGTDVSMSYHRPGVYDVGLTVIDEYSLSDTLIKYSYIQVDTIFGDIDYNEIVETADAYAVLSHVLGLTELDSSEFIIADVSTNSSLSPLDATLILQYANGLINELPYTPGTEFEAAGDIQMEDQDADPNMVLDIPVTLSNGSNIYGFTGSIHYDPAVLALDSLIFGDALNNYLVEFYEVAPGEIMISAAGITPLGEAGAFATLVVYVTEAFTEATSITITDLSWNEGEAVELAAEMTINFGLSVDGLQLPDVYALHQNYPNPFNPLTTLRYDLPENAMVNITIYDMMGRVVKTMVNSEQEAGFKSVQWDGTNHAGATVSAGLYLYTIQAGSFHKTKKMILLK